MLYVGCGMANNVFLPQSLVLCTVHRSSLLSALYTSVYCPSIQSGPAVHTGTHIVPQLSEGTWWSSDSVLYFLGSSGAKDQLPGN